MFCEFPSQCEMPKGTCCHFCKVKDCWQRCKDDYSKCKYFSKEKEEETPIIEEKPKEKKKRGRPRKNV